MRFKLPSGRSVVIAREAIGADVEKAFSAAGSQAGNPAAFAMALFAQVAQVDGVEPVYEDVRLYPAMDVMTIMAWSSGGAETLVKSGVVVEGAGTGTAVPLG